MTAVHAARVAASLAGRIDESGLAPHGWRVAPVALTDQNAAIIRDHLDHVGVTDRHALAEGVALTLRILDNFETVLPVEACIDLVHLIDLLEAP